MAFSYTILTTGDCQSNNSGIISFLPYGSTPPYTVEWVTPNLGTDIVSINPSVRTNLGSGTYFLRVNDSTLPTNQVYNINIPVSSGVCCVVVDKISTTCGDDNGSITATSTSNYSTTNYSLYTGADIFVTSASTNTSQIIFNNLTAGTYYIAAIDIGGCIGYSETLVVESSTTFDYGFYIVPNSSCGGQPIGKVFVTGETGVSPYTYFWSNGQLTNSISGLSEGNYTVTVTDSNGCSLSKNAVVGRVLPVGIAGFETIQPSCFASDGQVTVNITGGTAPFFYSASTGFVKVTYDTSLDITGLQAGTVQVKVTDAGFCSDTSSVSLITPNGMTSVSILGNNSSCSSTNGSISINVQGGNTPYTYTLVYPTGNYSIQTTANSSYDFNSLSAGTYSVYVRDFSGCVFTDEVTLITENKFTISASTSGTTCGLNNGSVQILMTSGGTSPFDFILDNTIGVIDTTLTSTTFNNLTFGTHSVSVVDATGCQQTVSFYIENSEPLQYSLYSQGCNTGNEGSITAFISSGEPPFTFNWSGNISGNPQSIIASGLSAGTYSVTITDSNGCSVTRNTDIICSSNFVSYQVYVMGAESFVIDSGTKCGLLQMLNEGYYDITSANTNCNLVSATFTAKVSVDPLGDVYTSVFYTTNSLLDAPSDNLWYDALRNLIYTIPGVYGVTINPLTNQIIIKCIVDGPLTNQIITVDVLIGYNITCEQ
jgi:hypothetical protein